mgnify:CR=1 FL=1
MACFVDPERIPALAEAWRRLVARRRGAGEFPWTGAILRALELDGYRRSETHRRGWIAEQLGVPIEVEDTGLGFLKDTGQVTFNGTHYEPEAHTVDTAMTPDVGRQLKVHWTEIAAERLRQNVPGQFSYNVFAVSSADLERIRELHLAYFRQLRAVVAESRPADVVAVVNVQLFSLGRP